MSASIAACASRNVPVEAIVPDSDDKAAAWLEQNRTYATTWPNITRKGEAAGGCRRLEGQARQGTIFLVGAREALTSW